MTGPGLFLARLLWSAGVVLASTGMLALMLAGGAFLLLAGWSRSTAAAVRRVWVTPWGDL
jgi:hypothetical protein